MCPFVLIWNLFPGLSPASVRILKTPFSLFIWYVLFPSTKFILGRVLSTVIFPRNVERPDTFKKPERSKLVNCCVPTVEIPVSNTDAAVLGLEP